MAQGEILDAFAEVLSRVAGINRTDITPEKSLTDDLGIDSLALVEVVVAAEDRFGVLVPDKDWSRFRTVRDVVEHLQQSTAANAR